MTAVAISDVEGATRTWLRGRAEISALVASRVFMGLPNTVIYPCITLRQIGGGLVLTYAPIHDALLQFDCFGNNKTEASQVGRTLVAVLADLNAGDVMDDQTVAFGASVASNIWLPDPETNQARYVVTASVSAKFSTYA